MKYNVTYKIIIEVEADSEEEAHWYSDEEMKELVDSVLDDPIQMWCELYKEPREIKLIEQ